MRGVLALILAGGVGSRLNVLVKRRAKPAVPFGSVYRIIDFTLSNAMNSGIERVGILTQYLPYSLTRHLGRGESWGLVGRAREARILPPHTGSREADWYRGTADAIHRNRDYIQRHAPEITLVLSGDHIYRMDYAAMIEHHIRARAGATIAVMRVPLSQAHLFGTILADGEDRITGFEEKPAQPTSDLVSLGVYAFQTDLLLRALDEVCGLQGGSDFGRDLFPFLLERERLSAYRFHGYWQDVGTIKAYFDTTMELLDPDSALDLPRWNVRTNLGEDRLGDHPPAYVASAARVRRSILARGCRIHGTVEGSALSPGVIVETGAVVRDSILLHDARVRAGAVVEGTVADKQVEIGPLARVGDPALGDEISRAFPTHLDQGMTVIGKGARLPARCRVGRNVSIDPGADLGRLEVDTVAAGESVRWEGETEERS
ncbi:MAG: glucose-1-phosphate adenylyltransferase [Candidatus Eisenbacteria bacterium]|uniref:Glucose-1-phosphate adenylyltransferase n=1 Tax=Eiseniibacteriota bacterium TaxID=2212470 RepID=A0A938BQN6_UNCEI|nr:glucose-1-phosphate adenylyltransferase [Candidatus Eisenbacteria bacterium]